MSTSRRDFFKIALPSLALVAVGCGSSTDTNVLFPATPTSTMTGLTQIFRSERDSSFFFDAAGNLFQVNQRTAEVQKFAPGGQLIWRVVLKGRGANQVDTPVALGVDNQQRVWLVDRSRGRLLLLTSAGQPTGTIEPPKPMLRPQDIVLDAQRAYVSDGFGHRIVVFDHNGQFLAAWADRGQLNYPRGLALDPAGRLHVADAANGRVVILDATGQIVGQYGSGLLQHPRGLAIRSDGLIAVADSLAGQIWFFAADLTRLGSLVPTFQGQPVIPLDVQFGPDGLLYLNAEPVGVV